jgi:hypothetical protein
MWHCIVQNADTNISDELAVLIYSEDESLYHPEDGRGRFLQNADTYPPDSMVSHLRTQCS